MNFMRLVLLSIAMGAWGCETRMALYEQTREGFQQLLDACGQEAVRRIELVLIPRGEPRRNPYGEFAFGYGGQQHSDLSLPNPAFWRHVDWVLKRITSRGWDAVLLVMEPGSFGDLAGEGKLLELGRYLGRRFGPGKGIVWLRPAGKGPDNLSVLEEGIRTFDSRHRWENSR
ncbi:MAG: DUF4038 domain-containing protein [Acidobacteriota bacterium]|jgi:hypothetical protein